MIATIRLALEALVGFLNAGKFAYEMSAKIAKARWENDLSTVVTKLESPEGISVEERKAMAKKLAELTANL